MIDPTQKNTKFDSSKTILNCPGTTNVDIVIRTSNELENKLVHEIPRRANTPQGVPHHRNRWIIAKHFL